MKNRIVSSLLVGVLLLGLFFGATQDTKTQTAMEACNDLPENIIDDNYRTCYEIFVHSFYDNNGDGIGDLNGITEKLDYLNDGDATTDTDLGINEIWLMPIMPSTTYHKYDVTDYYNIDPEYGTLEDFDKLVEECHNRDVHVIIDFVMNHTSSKHPWFVEACNYLKQLPEGQEPDLNECPYVGYYNFSKEKLANYYQVGNTSWYYEGKFWSEMPDLNLRSEEVRAEMQEIVAFWLDQGVDGFRLDATGEYFSGSDKANTEVLTWFNGMVKEMKPDAYLVGEAWMNYPQYSQYYESGIDSMFDFAFANYDGYIAKVLNGTAKSGASTYGLALEAVDKEIRQYTDDYIDAPFYTNHDMGRGAGYYTGEDDTAKTKMAQAMNLLMSGNTFLYYGEELGMYGSDKDEDKRLPMLWNEIATEEGMCQPPTGAGTVDMPYGSLEAQQENPYSIYNYVKQVIKLRNAYPEIARGNVQFLQDVSDKQICVIKKEYDGQELLLVFNTSNEEKEFDLSKVTVNGNKGEQISFAGMLQTSEEEPVLAEGKITLPKYTVVLLK